MPPEKTLSGPECPRPVISVSVHQILIIHSIHIYLSSLSILLKSEALTQQSEGFFVFCFKKDVMYVVWHFID